LHKNTPNMLRDILTILFRIFIGIFLIFGGIQHFVTMEFYLPFVPSFLPYKPAIIYGSGILEIIIGISFFIPKTKKFAAWVYLLLMLLFLPVHIADIYTDAPAMGTHQAAIVRLIVQFLLIALGVYFVRIVTTSSTEDYEN